MNLPDSGVNHYRIRAHFGLYGDDLKLVEVSRRLGMPPTKGHEKGQPRGKVAGETWECGHWGLSSFSAIRQEENLETHLDWILAQLSPSAGSIQAMVTAGFDARLYIGFTLLDGQGGPTLSATMLRRLADFGVRVEFEIQCPP